MPFAYNSEGTFHMQTLLTMEQKALSVKEVEFSLGYSMGSQTRVRRYTDEGKVATALLDSSRVDMEYVPGDKL